MPRDFASNTSAMWVPDWFHSLTPTMSQAKPSRPATVPLMHTLPGSGWVITVVVAVSGVEQSPAPGQASEREASAATNGKPGGSQMASHRVTQ